MSRRGNRKHKRNSKPEAPQKAGAVLSPHRVLIWIVSFYVALLAIMAAFGRYGFIMKSMIVPLLLLAALLTGRLKRFVNEWIVFVAAVEFFDFGRGLAFALTSHFELPMHLQYVVNLDRWLCGGAVAPERMQRLRAGLANPYWLDRFFVLVYSSHFVLFLIFGLVVWSTRRQAFRAYTIEILGVLYGGLLGYFLVPTVPPWMAANEFVAIPPITQFVRVLYNIHMPRLLAAFDVNTIAAMPSVHAAIPAACALFALRHFGRRGLPMLAYAMLVWIAVIYLGEHYLTDVLAGILLALLVHLGVSRWIAVPTQPSDADEGETQWQIRPIAFALTLITVAYGVGQLSAQWIGPLPVTVPFVERELLGRSPTAHYLLGRLALEKKQYAEAELDLGRSLGELTDPAQQDVIRHFLAVSAHGNGDLPATIAALEPVRSTTANIDSLILLASTYAESNRNEDCIAVLQEARHRFPDAPEPLYRLAQFEYSRGEMDAAHVEQVVETLKHLPSSSSETFQLALSDMLQKGQAPQRSMRDD